MKKHITLVLVLLSTVASTLAQDGDAPSDETKPVIRSEADLPRFEYDLATESASALLADPNALAGIMVVVKSDLATLLDDYVIEDNSTLREVNGSLLTIALLERDYVSAQSYIQRIRELQEKPSDKLVSGLVSEAIVTAELAEGGDAERKRTFRDTYSTSVAGLPWDIVQDDIESLKGSMEIISENLYVGMVQSQFDPASIETGMISGDVARSIIGVRSTVDVVLPYRTEIVEVLGAYIDANRVEKPDIWAERDLDLSSANDLTEVVVAVWDTGVDPPVFGEAMFVNPNETLNGKDDDGNGFVDDVHGIAWTLWGREPSPDVLFPLDESVRANLGETKFEVKGLLDVQAGLDTPEAQALKKKMSQMQPEEVQPFIENLSRFSVYSHGTHVAGIAAQGNPAARVLVVRETFPYEMIPPPILVEDARTFAASFHRTVDYLKANEVRVVNMSWGVSARDIEGDLESNGLGADAADRQQMAAEAFGILMDGMREAMASAPEILFVPAAGNSDDDVGFTEDMPAAIDLPNVLSVGAVDQAGDETGFTSYGERVRVHANGFEVDSYLPGGDRMKFSGTSMAAPNAANLAAKLIALDPSLTPERVIELMIKGADTTEDGRRILINGKRSVELL